MQICETAAWTEFRGLCGEREGGGRRDGAYVYVAAGIRLNKRCARGGERGMDE